MWHDPKAMNATASGIYAVTVLACLAGLVWKLSQLPMFALKTIRVESMYDVELKHVNVLTLRENGASKLQGNFFTTKLEDVRANFESVPWVRRATVRREWPDQLIVSVEEHEALGTWGEDGRMLSVKGDVFTANIAEADEDHVLPEFNGPDGSEKEVLARFGELRSWFAPLGLAPVGVYLSKRYAWTVRLDNGMSVALGREQDHTTLKHRVDRLVRIYPQLAERVPQGIDTIDMRYTYGLALSAAGLKATTDKNKPQATAAKTNTKHT